MKFEGKTLPFKTTGSIALEIGLSTDRIRIRNPDVGVTYAGRYLVELGLDSILEDKILLSNAGPLQAVHQLSPGVPRSRFNKKEVPLFRSRIRQWHKNVRS